LFISPVTRRGESTAQHDSALEEGKTWPNGVAGESSANRQLPSGKQYRHTRSILRRTQDYPFTGKPLRFSGQGLKPTTHSIGFVGTTEVMPCYKAGPTGVFPQPVKSCFLGLRSGGSPPAPSGIPDLQLKPAFRVPIKKIRFLDGMGRLAGFGGARKTINSRERDIGLGGQIKKTLRRFPPAVDHSVTHPTS